MAVYAITDKCNLNCIFCSNEDFMAYYEPPKYKPHTIQELKEYFKKNINVSEDNLTLTGGEPTLRKDLIEILKFINKEYKKSEILLLTNGRLFSYEIYAKKFTKIKNLVVEVALQSHKKKNHEKLTDSIGSYNQTLEGIKNLLNFGIKTNIRIVVNKLNYLQMLEFMKFIKQEFYAINKIVFVNLRIRGNAKKNKQKLIIKYSNLFPELYDSFDFILKNKIKLQLLHFPFCILNNKYWKFTLENPYKKELEKCKNCSEKQNCPGVLESYIKEFNDDEFKTI
jgi:His-Xaa-Ser system radical SAM maturase HxsC